MEKIFVDSAAFIALYDIDDINHLSAKDISRAILEEKIPAVTTNFIIDETLTYLLKKVGFKAALRCGRIFFENSHEIEFVRIEGEVEMEAWQVFKKFNRDKRWSFTDCTSYVLMKSMGINTVFTFDRRDFRQVGFKIL